MKPKNPYLPILTALGAALLLLAFMILPLQPAGKVAAAAEMRPRANPVITLGVAAATGVIPDIGWPQINAVQLAVDQINEAGGLEIGGVTYTLVISTVHTACQGGQAVTAAQQLLDAGAVAAIGFTCSSESLPAQATFAAAGVPLISASSTNPQLTEQGYSTTFRVISRDDQPPAQMAAYLIQRLGLTRGAVVELNGQSLNMVNTPISATFARFGGTLSRHTALTSTDFLTLLTSIRTENPQILFYADSDAARAAQFSKAAVQAGLGQVPIAWTTATDDRSILNTYATEAASAAEGDYALMYYRPTDLMPGYHAFNLNYQAAGFPNYGSEAGMAGAYAYDAAGMIVEAIRRAGSITPTEIRTALAAASPYQGIVGRYAGFDGKGDVLPQWGWLEERQNGAWISRVPTRVGLATDNPVIMDNGWNEAAYIGLQRTVQSLGVAGKVYTTSGPAEFTPTLQRCADEGNDLCLAVGWTMGEAAMAVAQNNSRTLFGGVDITWDGYPENLRGLTFASRESAYLAGTLAGLMTHNHHAGIIGGMPISPVVDFVEGYQQGLTCINPTAVITTVYASDFDMESAFSNPGLGAQLAHSMTLEGADIIFAPAGETGTGAVLTATHSGFWGIGVDMDYYDTVYNNGTVPGSDKLLTSVLKKVDNVVAATIADVVAGRFTPGTRMYGLYNDGVGLAPFHATDGAIPGYVRARLERLRLDLIEGDINPLETCPTYMEPITTVIPLTQSLSLTGSEQLVRLNFAANTFSQTATLAYLPRPTAVVSNPLLAIGLFFDIDATAGSLELQPLQSFTLTVAYRDEEIRAAGIRNEADLALYYWNGSRWVKEAGTIDTGLNRITVHPTHLSTWAVLAYQPYTLYLPVVMRRS